jgi:hypothetical protein
VAVKLYPDVPARRNATIARDVLLVGLLVLFGWLGWRTYLRVESLTVVADGVEEAGTSVEDGFDSAAGAVDGLPVVGDDLSGALTDAGDDSGGEVAEYGRQGAEDIRQLATLSGLLVFGLPAAVTLLVMVPPRVRQIRRMHQARAVLADVHDPERRRLLAMRAAFGLPFETLLRHTRDPLGDLAADRLDGLVEAVLEEAGLLAVPAGWSTE